MATAVQNNTCGILEHLRAMLGNFESRLRDPEKVANLSPSNKAGSEEPSAKEVRLAIKDIEEKPHIGCDYCKQFSLLTQGLLCPDSCSNP